jgi:phosphopantothenoylcysteine decarboxylase/phosphopantothenate--cysteine ligase
MGYAIAEAARDLGADTILISGPATLAVPAGVTFESVETTDQMHQAVDAHFKSCHCLIMAAAPADYTPTSPAASKMKKRAKDIRLALRPTIDILAEMGRKKGKRILVGFALETDDGVDNARKKLRAKKLDLIVLNNPRDEGAAFDFDTNKITLIFASGDIEEYPLMDKSDVACLILEKIAALL